MTKPDITYNKKSIFPTLECLFKFIGEFLCLFSDFIDSVGITPTWCVKMKLGGTV